MKRFYTLLKPDEQMLSQIEREHDVNRERKAEVILVSRLVRYYTIFSRVTIYRLRLTNARAKSGCCK